MRHNLLQRRLTARETALVLLAALAAGALGYAAYLFIKAKWFDAKVAAELPRTYDVIRKQRAGLVKAIEAYKTQFGVYPPDHVLQRQPLLVDPVTNTLLYELAGVVHSPSNNLIQVAALEAADATFVKQLLQCDEFRNRGQTDAEVKHFLSRDQVAVRQFHDDPDVYALAVPLDASAPDAEAMWAVYSGISSWYYVSSAPTNNPGRFDLWVELKTKKGTLIIGNWPAAD